MGSIKGVGEGSVTSIIEERDKSGAFNDIFNFVERVNLSAVNKKNLEGLALSGALDGFGLNRSQYFVSVEKDSIFLENLLRYGNKYQADKASTSNSLFGGGNTVSISKPEVPRADEWGTLEKLNKEKELVGIYLSAHPLDQYKLEIEHFCNTKLGEMSNLSLLNGKDISIAGLVTEARTGQTKTGKPYGAATIEDYTGAYKLMLFGNDWIKYSNFFVVGYALYIKGKVQPRQYGNNELEVNIKSVNMLTDVREQMVKGISIVVPIQLITDDLILVLKEHTENVKGKAELKFKIIDREDNMVVELYSRTQKVNITQELIHCLNSYEEIDFRLN
jgi:DNA polymerase-3 subunit alpha